MTAAREALSTLKPQAAAPEASEKDVDMDQSVEEAHGRWLILVLHRSQNVFLSIPITFTFVRTLFSGSSRSP